MWWPYVVTLGVLFGLLFLSQRRRRSQLAQEMVRISQIHFGSEVMTTSGLYATVVGTNDDGTVQLAIAPGVEVKWARAALRDAESLPAQYRRGLGEDDGDVHEAIHDDDIHGDIPTNGEPGPDRPDEPENS